MSYARYAVIMIKLERWEKAVTYSTQALEFQPTNAKALMRRAKVKRASAWMLCLCCIPSAAQPSWLNAGLHQVEEVQSRIDRRRARLASQP